MGLLAVATRGAMLTVASLTMGSGRVLHAVPFLFGGTTVPQIPGCQAKNHQYGSNEHNTHSVGVFTKAGRAMRDFVFHMLSLKFLQT